MAARTLQGHQGSSDTTLRRYKTIDEIAFKNETSRAQTQRWKPRAAGEEGAGFAHVASPRKSARSPAAATQLRPRETPPRREPPSRRLAGRRDHRERTEEASANVGRSASSRTVAEGAQASNEQSQGIGAGHRRRRQMDKVDAGQRRHAEESAAPRGAQRPGDVPKDVVGEFAPPRRRASHPAPSRPGRRPRPARPRAPRGTPFAAKPRPKADANWTSRFADPARTGHRNGSAVNPHLSDASFGKRMSHRATTFPATLVDQPLFPMPLPCSEPLCNLPAPGRARPAQPGRSSLPPDGWAAVSVTATGTMSTNSGPWMRSTANLHGEIARPVRRFPDLRVPRPEQLSSARPRAGTLRGVRRVRPAPA